MTPDSPVIVHILNGLRFGGNETLCLQLLRQAPPQVHNILLNLDAAHQEMLPSFAAIPGLAICHSAVALRPRYRFVRSLRGQFHQWQPQAVLIYPFGIHPFAGLAARWSNIPVVAVHAGNPPPPRSKDDRWKWRLLIGFSWVLNISVHGCSHATHTALSRLMPLPPHSFAIPVGCDLQEIARRASLGRSSRAEGDRIIIGMVARLNPIKDQATLVRAFGQLCQTHHNLELWLVGDGEQRQALEQLCDRLGLVNRVKFWGARADVPELLGQMDIYAFSTTEEEGFGIALIEAMAASLPVVASNVAACREVLGNGEAGVLVAPQDVAAMAKALEIFAESTQARQRWGQRAYHRAIKHYDIQTCAQTWYDCLLNPRKTI